MSNKRQVATRWKNFRKNPEKSSEPTKDCWSSEEFTLMFHTATFSSSDIILNQDVFSGLAEKDILEIIPVDTLYPPFLVQLSSDSFISKNNTTISISSQLASVLSLATLRSLEVTVSRFTSTKYDCEELVMSIKDQHICKSHIWTCSKYYIGLALYKGQLITKSGFRSIVCHMTSSSKELSTAIITKNTKITFRSKSCKMMILIEMSKEMWEVSPSGIIYWEKMMTFLTTCFERQIIRRVSHEIDIIFYSKIHSNSSPYNLFRTVLKITDLRNSWMDALKAIKREINFFPSLIGWDTDIPPTAEKFKFLFPMSNYNKTEKLVQSFHQSMTYHTLKNPFLTSNTSVSISSNSCFLEAINYSLTRLENEEIKNFTGNTLMIISAGTGLYNVNLGISKVTKVRVLGLGVSVNLMSMKRHPLHKYPLFVYENDLIRTEPPTPEFTQRTGITFGNTKKQRKPIWFSIHFFFSFMQLEATCNLQSAIHMQVHERHKKFMPLFRLGNIPGDGLPHVKSKLSKDIIFDKNDLNKTVNGMKFQLLIHDSAIFVRNEVIRTEDLHALPTNRKWSIQRTQERSMSRKDSTESYRRESSIFGAESKKDSMLSGVYYIVKKKKNSSFKRRWIECYKVKKEISEELLKDDNQINGKQVLDYYETVWSSLLEPCLLPLYNDFWPKSEDLGASQPYQNYVNEKIQRQQAIDNLIGLRLNKGFQIVRKNAIDKFGAKMNPPDIAMSLGQTYHVIIPDSNDEFTLRCMIHCSKATSVQASAQLTIFNPELKVFETREEIFTFNYPTSWTEQDSKMLGH